MALYDGEEVVLYLTEETGEFSSYDKSVCYYQINEKSQIFIIDDNLAVNGLGQKINVQKDVVMKITEKAAE